MDELQASFLSVKLKYLEQWTLSRRRIAARYRDALKGTGDLRFFRENEGNEAVYHLFVVRSSQREALGAHLKDMGVDTGVHYPIPLHLQPAYQFLGYKGGAFPVSEKHSREMLSLPIFPEMTDAQVDYVVDQAKRFFQKA
jgi:dTDP-4-amino-4,6-dideoxygalactose transaminase